MSTSHLSATRSQSTARGDAGGGLVTTIAILKFATAVLFMMIGLGTLEVLGAGLARFAEHVATAVSPAVDRDTVQNLVSRVSGFSREKIAALGIGSFMYAVLYVAQGVGLCRRKRWGEYLTIAVTASFIPFEVYALVQEVSVTGVSSLVLNVATVAYLVLIVWRRG